MLAGWQEHLPGPPLPLRTRQCLILSASKALFVQSGRLWLNNLYLAAALPNPTRQALLLSTGYVGGLGSADFFKTSKTDVPGEDGWPACSQPTDLSLYLTDVVLQSSPHAGSAAVALMPLTFNSSVSLLAQSAPPDLPRP